MIRNINTRDKKRLAIIHNSGPLELLMVRPLKLRFACKHSVLVWLNRMRSRGILEYDMDDIEGLVFTDFGRELIE